MIAAKLTDDILLGGLVTYLKDFAEAISKKKSTKGHN